MMNYTNEKMFLEIFSIFKKLLSIYIYIVYNG